MILHTLKYQNSMIIHLKIIIEYQLRNFRTFELRLRYGVEVQQMNPDIVNPESVFTISIQKFFLLKFLYRTSSKDKRRYDISDIASLMYRKVKFRQKRNLFDLIYLMYSAKQESVILSRNFFSSR